MKIVIDLEELRVFCQSISKLDEKQTAQRVDSFVLSRDTLPENRMTMPSHMHEWEEGYVGGKPGQICRVCGRAR